jgi:hypothetical protein
VAHYAKRHSHSDCRWGIVASPPIGFAVFDCGSSDHSRQSLHRLLAQLVESKPFRLRLTLASVFYGKAYLSCQ